STCKMKHTIQIVGCKTFERIDDHAAQQRASDGITDSEVQVVVVDSFGIVQQMTVFQPRDAFQMLRVVLG
ncbi:MAG: hypothetical protein AAF525_22000, partial [Pseudomonadota bacterium]